MKVAPHSKEAELPLCVDLDGSVLRTDLSMELLAGVFRTKPWRLFLLSLWALRGRAYVKSQLGKEVPLDIPTLPIRKEVIEYLCRERKRGRQIILVTASPIALARLVAEELGIFDDVVGSSNTLNLKGENKADYLEKRFGLRGFEYLGDSVSDIAVWRRAARAHVVSDSKRFVDRVRSLAEVGETFRSGEGGRQLVRAIRPHQWVKNLLVFIPLIMAHALWDLDRVSQTILAFWILSFCASGIYLVNDICDLEADRRHRQKCRRPLASGAVPIEHAALLAAVLLSVAFGLSVLFMPRFIPVLLVYLVTTVSYSYKLKRVAGLDIVILAFLYSLRVFAGAVSGAVEVSQWLLAFSLFFFFSLASVKRVSELVRNETSPAGRGYEPGDVPQLSSIGGSSGLLSILVLALYINSEAVKRLYEHPDFLWALCLCLLYWVTRIWLLASRGKVHEDPVVFALQDRASYVTGLICLIILSIAM